MMDKKAITLEQLEESIRDLTRWIRDKLLGYIEEPKSEGKSGYVLMTNGAGGRSWEYIQGAGEQPDKTLTIEGAPADAAAAGTAIRTVGESAAEAQETANQAKSTAEGVSLQSLGGEQKRLQFTAVSIEPQLFSVDGTYEDFPFRASKALEGVTAAMVPEVIFGIETATSGNYAPTAESYDGGLYIYAKEVPEDAVTVTVLMWR